MSMSLGLYRQQKKRQAEAACLAGFTTAGDVIVPEGSRRIVIPWSQRLFDGPFFVSRGVSLVFVQSKDGNTCAANPSALGAGAMGRMRASGSNTSGWRPAAASGG